MADYTSPVSCTLGNADRIDPKLGSNSMKKVPAKPKPLGSKAKKTGKRA